jgi:hypothetical protein
MSYTDAVSRISQIQAQIGALNNAFTPQTAAPAATSSGTPAATSSGGAAVGATSFASALAQAAATPATGGASVSSAPLSAKASGMLTTGQQQFASRLAADTGLDPGVIAAWLLAEESGGAATSRQSANNNDWLNIGYTDSGTYGSSGSQWSDPIAAADASAGWLKGQNTVPGYGTASAGIQAVLHTAGQTPAAQIAALQQSGWASSGYPDLPSLYQQVAG